MGNVSCCRPSSPKQATHDNCSHHNHQSNGSCDCRALANDNTKRQYSKKSKDNVNNHGTVFKNLSGHDEPTSTNLQHISEREPDDSENDPSSNPHNQPIFVTRSLSVCKAPSLEISSIENNITRKKSNSLVKSNQEQQQFKHATNPNVSSINNTDTKNKLLNSNKISETLAIAASEIARTRKNFRSLLAICDADSNVDQRLPRCSSCATILIDDSSISQPHLKTTIKCVSIAIYYHIVNRASQRSLDIFDEIKYPLQKSYGGDASMANPKEQQTKSSPGVAPLLNPHQDPDQRTIYQYVRALFNAAQLTSEYAIITLVYIERLMTYAEIDILPHTWRRIFLGAIVLTSKVWEDQAVWNVDYCQILNELSVEDINELERQFLELIQFNMNVPSSVYAKYYFNLRSLAHENGLLSTPRPLTAERAKQLEVRQLIG